MLENNIVLFYALPFLAAFVLALGLTPLTRKLALRFGTLDLQDEERKTHPSRVIPQSGWSVIGSFLIVVAIAWALNLLTDQKIYDHQIIAIFVAAILLGLHGYLDDKYSLRPWQAFIIPTIASALVVWLGVSVGYITNPLEAGTGPFGRSLVYFAPLAGAIFSFVWLMGMMYTVKFLDGLDGLVVGIGAIGSIILFVVSLFWDVPLSGTSVLALILAGSLLGFLPYNWHPARIFMGESSIFIGFMLGVLSIISGAKLATALLIIGIPILDVIWVITRRMFKEKHSPFLADRKHLHFRLLDVGLSHKQTVIGLYFLTAFFGTISIFLQSQQKVIALVVLVIVMLLLAIILVRAYQRRVNK